MPTTLTLTLPVTYSLLPLKRPAGVTIIAILILLAGVLILLLPGDLYYRGIGAIRDPWKFGLSVFYIAVGIGLLVQAGWARLAAITIATLGIGLSIIALLSGFRQMRPIYVFSNFFGLPRDGLIIWYLLKPRIAGAFGLPEESTLNLR